MNRVARYSCLVLVTLFFGIGGVAHFTSAEQFARTIPFLPYPTEVVYITGVIELVAIVLLWIPRHRQWAGTALFVYTICVTPANIFMVLRPELFPGFDTTYHVLRLTGQVLLLWMIWWSTRMPSSPSAGEIPRAA
jgi:uncharacterized membrane protein